MNRWVFVVILLFSLPVAADTLSNLAEELIKLRTEVEAKSAEVEMKKQELKNRLRTLALQKAEVEAAIQKESLRVKQIQVALSKKKADSSADAVDPAQLKPVVEKAISGAEKIVEAGVPFKKTERLAELNDIRTQVAAGSITPFAAIARLWSFYEDEYRMTKENGIFRQAITVDGVEKLADVARLGTIMMFFRLSDGTLGRVVRSGERWDYRVEEDKKQKERIAILFDALKKQIRTGYFELPDVLPAQGAPQ